MSHHNSHHHRRATRHERGLRRPGNASGFRDRQMRAAPRQGGFSIAEILIVLAVIGVLATVVIGGVGQSRPDTFGGAVQAAMQHARFEAIKRNRAVVFAWDDASKQFITRVKNATASAATSQSCGSETGDITLSSIKQSNYKGVTVTGVTFLRDTSTAGTSGGAALYGVVWQPHGLPKRCNANSTLLDSRSFGFAKRGSTTVAYRATLNPAGMVGGTP